MTKNDIGTIVAGAAAVAASLLGMARTYLAGLARRVGASFANLIASPAVWLAVGATFLVGFGSGFVGGHLEGASGKRELRAEVVRLTARAKAGHDAAAVAEKREAAALAAAKTLAAKVESQQAELVRLGAALKARPVPQASRVVPVVRRAVPKAVKKPPPASDPASAWARWNS